MGGWWNKARLMSSTSLAAPHAGERNACRPPEFMYRRRELARVGRGVSSGARNYTGAVCDIIG